MNTEISYTESVSYEHIKKHGQYFTHPKIANFMCAWACKDAKYMLDPAVGNSIFFIYTQKYSPTCKFTGYEVDTKILNHFGNPSGAHIINADYLSCEWDKKYDAIVCNPPYNRFQNIDNRSELIESVYLHTGIKCSGYTNLYILFLIKSIYQLSENGKLAYIVPSEFMNSKYGIEIKQLLINKKLLRAVINFENDNDIFFNATTTCCILLIDHQPKTQVIFKNIHSIDELQLNILNNQSANSTYVNFESLKSEKKWHSYMKQEPISAYKNLKPISHFCKVSRGIATGSNNYFCFSLSKAKHFGIPNYYLKKCICRSSDIKKCIFTPSDFTNLANEDKTVYLLDITSKDSENIKSYIEYGEKNGINKKYIPSHRTPWYSVEHKNIAPIWVSSAFRENMKFIRNTTTAKTLTTFHSIFIHQQYIDDTNLIFCYFLTPIAQSIIYEDRKILGNNLNKFQPNDLNYAKMLDLSLITKKDRIKISEIYNCIKNNHTTSYIKELNHIFSSYLYI